MHHNPLPRFLLSLGLLALLLVACTPAATPPPVDVNATALADAMLIVGAQMTQTAQYTPAPTETPVPTPTIPRTPPALPGMYQSSYLNPSDTPHTYVQDTCEYLKAKWNPNNAAPGTLVMIIMFHSINKGDAADPEDISSKDFQRLMNDLKDMGFEAIRTEQLADFLDYNAKIPARSVVILQDDRHSAENYNTHFRPYWEQWGWPVVNAWISLEDSIGARVLPENIPLAQEGFVDYQSHGVVHNRIMGDHETDEYITSELQGSRDAILNNFGQAPIGIIWPGGGFGVRPAQIARQVGYRVGFTINPRGPVMYNWIPLAEEKDPRRPAYIPEGPAGDPRMTLPRYWPSQVRGVLDQVRAIGKEAADYAEQNKAIELDYYDIVCAPSLGPLPALAP
jgi:hypothetical protein